MNSVGHALSWGFDGNFFRPEFPSGTPEQLGVYAKPLPIARCDSQTGQNRPAVVDYGQAARIMASSKSNHSLYFQQGNGNAGFGKEDALTSYGIWRGACI
jgi:hypothetical protein